MKTPKELHPLVAAIRSLQRLIDRFDQQGIIIGGVAVGLLSKPRYTADADAVIFLSIVDLEKLLDAAKQDGFEPRYPNVPEFARAHRLVALVHKRTGVHVDISLGAMPFEKAASLSSRLFQWRIIKHWSSTTPRHRNLGNAWQRNNGAQRRDVS